MHIFGILSFCPAQRTISSRLGVRWNRKISESSPPPPKKTVFNSRHFLAWSAMRGDTYMKLWRISPKTGDWAEIPPKLPKQSSCSFPSGAKRCVEVISARSKSSRNHCTCRLLVWVWKLSFLFIFISTFLWSAHEMRKSFITAKLSLKARPYLEMKKLPPIRWPKQLESRCSYIKNFYVGETKTL